MCYDDTSVSEYQEKICQYVYQAYPAAERSNYDETFDEILSNALAKAMGYKGITVKMTKTVDEMLAEGVLEKVMVETRVKYSVVGA